MSQDWTEAQLEEQLKEYVERRALLKRLTDEHKMQGELIRLYYQAHNLQSCSLDNARVAVVSKTKIEYSDTYRRDKAKASEDFKKREQVEIENFHNPNTTALCNARATTRILTTTWKCRLEKGNEISISSICVGRISVRDLVDPLAHREADVQSTHA